MAKRLAKRLATRWPAGIQVQVRTPAKGKSDNGYSVSVTVLCKNRTLRMVKESDLSSVVMICAELLGEELPQQSANELTPEDKEIIRASYGPYVPRGQPGSHHRGQISIERLAQQYHVSRRKIVEVLQTHE